MTAWRPAAQRNTTPSSYASHDRPLSRHTNGHVASPREKATSDVKVEGRSSAQSHYKRTNAAKSKKAADAAPTLDKRTKTILDILKSKRESKQSDASGAESDRNGAAAAAAAVSGDITTEKFITYPKFVVKTTGEKKKQKQVEFKEQTSQDGMDGGGLARSSSMRYAVKSHGFANGGRSEMQRDMDARRSYRQQKSIHDHMNFSSIVNQKYKNSMTSLDQNRIIDNLNDQSVDDIVMNILRPDEMRDYLQAKSLHPNSVIRPGSTTPFQGRTGSPPYEQYPPPPTPASQLLMQLGVDATDPARLDEELKYENIWRQERRRSLRDQTKNRTKGGGTTKRDKSDPGVSNTTQQLIQHQVVKRQFQFPQLTAEAHRKSLVTPRHDDTLYFNRMSPGLYVKQKTIHVNGVIAEGANNHKAAVHASPVNSYDVTVPLEETREKSLSKQDLSASHDQLMAPDVQRSQSSVGMATVGGMTRSHSFYHGQRRDKQTRMISLGLPRVNLDIDRYHFRQNSFMRRSQELREKHNMSEQHQKTIDSNVSEQESAKHDSSKTTKATEETEPHDGRNATSAHALRGRKSAASGRYRASATSEAGDSDVDDFKGPGGSGHLKFCPPPNTPIDEQANVFQRRSAVRKKSSKLPVKVRAKPQVDPTKGAVGVSFFKMTPPGEKNIAGTTKHNEKPSDAQKYAYGVTLASDEIFL